MKRQPIKPIKPQTALTSKDEQTLKEISQTVSSKIKQRLNELKQDPNFHDLKHVQVNYFNISKLGIKYQHPLQRKVGMSYGDAVVENTHTSPDQPSQYLCVTIFFDENQLTPSIFQMLLGLTSKVHNWQYSKTDNIYLDALGVYVDRVDFEKETKEEDTNVNDTTNTIESDNSEYSK